MTAELLPAAHIYTDGACDPNPGPGGWAAILLRPRGDPEQLCGAEENTTNNRMELRAVIEGLRALTVPHEITLHTDSQYVSRGITEWLPEWQRDGWQRTGTRSVKNADLWQQLVEQAARHQIRWQWVKGHAGDRWNEAADALASSMLPSPTLPLDDDKAIHLFTAASCLGSANGPGGWCAILRYQGAAKALSGYEAVTTGNRMHLQAVILGLQAIKKPLPVHVYTTADYVQKGMTHWLAGWQRRGWQTEAKKEVAHRDLWEALAKTMQGMEVSVHVVAGQDLPDRMAALPAMLPAQRQALTRVRRTRHPLKSCLPWTVPQTLQVVMRSIDQCPSTAERFRRCSRRRPDSSPTNRTVALGGRCLQRLHAGDVEQVHRRQAVVNGLRRIGGQAQGYGTLAEHDQRGVAHVVNGTI